MIDNKLPSLSIMIVNWNSGKQLFECLVSISKADKTDFILEEVIVVDNASFDNSLDGIKKIKLPLKILRNTENHGFAKACNQGAKISHGNYILFLNPDTVLTNDSLAIPISFMEKGSSSKFGIAGVKSVDQYGNISRNCARFPNGSRFILKNLRLDKLFPKVIKGHFMNDWDHNRDQIVDQIMGAYFMIRKNIFDDLGGFDERYFMYFEDVDLSLKMKYSGFLSIFLAGTQIYHLGGGTSEQVKAHRLFYFQRSRIIYYFNHFDLVTALLNLYFVYFIDPVIGIFGHAVRNSLEEVKGVFHAQYFLIRDFLNIIWTAGKDK